ncbi:MAG: autotransporter outer membrane beta-barrel domain-containing protein, partial [Comamonas sp.]|uniref:autotransporter family protein n=2 Tax=Comamonas sp. TaxID=34028 RepID=UPI002FC74794
PLPPSTARKRPADLTVDIDTRMEFDGKMGRAARLVKRGRGTLVLNQAGEMRNGVHLKQGRIELGHAAGLGAGSLVMDDGSAIDLAVGSLVVANDLHMPGSDDPEINTGDHHQTWAGAISGTGFLTKQGTGSLTLTSAANRYSGATEVAQGTLQAGGVNTFSAASVHGVAAAATLHLAGFDQTLAGLSNRGTVQLSAASAAPGTVLRLTGPYVGQGGELAVAASADASDRMLLSGAAAVASGNTTVRITNVGDLGVATTGSGIEVIATEDGARLEPEAFSLAGGHVDAGAYEYRLHQTEQGASLQSAYRAEVPLLAALPAQLRQADLDMLGDMHQRLGDAPGNAGNDRRAWGRLLRTAPRIRQQGAVSPQSSGHLEGFQTGLDLYAGSSANAGFYLGQLKGHMRVNGLASTALDKHAGANRLHGRYLGLYASWRGDSGMYADTVLQWADHRSHSHAQESQAQTKGRSRLASLEVGQPLGLDSRWQIEPQAQLVYRQLRLDDTALRHAAVQHKTPGDWTLRVGARIKGSFVTSAGVLQPYGSVNVYKASSTADVARFVVPAATTDIQTRGGHIGTALAAGATLQVNPRTSFYGELSHHWANGGNARVGSGVQASAGVKLRW